MHFDRPTLRDLAVGLGLLGPLRRAEENDACESARRTSKGGFIRVREVMCHSTSS